jgi:hypothetical protein
MSENLLTEYDIDFLLACSYGCRIELSKKMRLAISIYWPKRSNHIARKRIRSAIKVIREIAA